MPLWTSSLRPRRTTVGGGPGNWPRRPAVQDSSIWLVNAPTPYACLRCAAESEAHASSSLRCSWQPPTRTWGTGKRQWRHAEAAGYLVHHALGTSQVRRDIAIIYVVTGRHEEAVAILRDLLSRPGDDLSPAILRLDPIWNRTRCGTAATTVRSWTRSGDMARGPGAFASESSRTHLPRPHRRLRQCTDSTIRSWPV